MPAIMEKKDVVMRSPGGLAYGCLPNTSGYKQEGIS